MHKASQIAFSNHTIQTTPPAPPQSTGRGTFFCTWPELVIWQWQVVRRCRDDVPGLIYQITAAPRSEDVLRTTAWRRQWRTWFDKERCDATRREGLPFATRLKFRTRTSAPTKGAAVTLNQSKDEGVNCRQGGPRMTAMTSRIRNSNPKGPNSGPTVFEGDVRTVCGGICTVCGEFARYVGSSHLPCKSINHRSEEKIKQNRKRTF